VTAQQRLLALLLLVLGVVFLVAGVIADAPALSGLGGTALGVTIGYATRTADERRS
jgi:membrane-bound ClpP family serine protease